MIVHNVSPLNRRVPVSQSGLAGLWFTLREKIAPFLRWKVAGPSCTIMVPVIESREKALRGEAAKKRIHSSAQATPTKCPNSQAPASLPLPQSLPQSWTPHRIPWILLQLGLQAMVLSSNPHKLVSVTSSHLLSLNGEIFYRQRSLPRWTSPGVMTILWKRMKRNLCWNLRLASTLIALVLRVLLPGRHSDRFRLSVVSPYQKPRLVGTRPPS